MSERIVIGRIRSAHGVRGWLKVQSFTSPEGNLFTHPRWGLSRIAEKDPYVELDVEQYKTSGKDLLVLLEGLEDREQALKHGQAYVSVPLESMASLADDEVYWHQLEGMEVFRVRQTQPAGFVAEPSSFEDAERIGYVAHMLETGAADVLVIDPPVPVPQVAARDAEVSLVERDRDSKAKLREDKETLAGGRSKESSVHGRKTQNRKQPQPLMVPYVLGHSVLQVDVEARRILIDWQFD